MSEERIGRVTHYWPKAHAAQVELEDAVLRKGDHIHIRGHGHDVEETVESIQIDHKPVSAGHPGEPVAIEVPDRVKEGDEVWRDTSSPKE